MSRARSQSSQCQPCKVASETRTIEDTPLRTLGESHLFFYAKDCALTHVIAKTSSAVSRRNVNLR